MNENHKRFADKYFETLNASQSAIYAGFSEDTSRQQGWQLLQREDVQNYLSKLKAEYSEKSGITKEWVMTRFKDISDDAFSLKDFGGANKATEMLGKIIGSFEKDNEQKKSEVNINLSKEKIKQISDTLENDL
jgi:phage terminase small subunit